MSFAATAPVDFRFAQQLLEKRVVTEPQLELALLEQKRSGQTLHKLLVQLGFVSPQKLADCLASQSETKAVNLNTTRVEDEAIQLVSRDLARRFKALPISLRDHTLTVALADPFDVVAIDALQQVTGYSIDVVTAPENDILNFQEVYYVGGQTIEGTIDQILEEKAKDGGERPAARGHGIGAALIEWLRNAMRAEGWARLYWMTKADNIQARKLYDRYAMADGFVRYQIRQR